jgi:hypothetical protein
MNIYGKAMTDTKRQAHTKVNDIPHPDGPWFILFRAAFYRKW